MARRIFSQSRQPGSPEKVEPVFTVNITAGVTAYLRRFSLCVAGTLMLVVLAPPPLHAAAPAPLTLDDLFSTPTLFGVTPSAPAWSPDSRHMAFTWNNAGMPQRSLWVVSPDNAEPRQLGSASSEGSVRDFAWLSASRLLSLRGDALWLTTLEGEESMLADIGPGASDLGISPDGRTAAYRQDGDLWLFDVEERKTIAATDVGIPRLSSLPIGRYARPEREIGPGIWGGPTWAWSPDSKTIAVHYVDRRGMRKVPFPDYLAEDTEPNEVRRGYPGDPNEMRTVGLLDVASGELRLLELENPTANQVVGFAWSPDGVLLLDLASDTAEDRWLYTVQPDSNDLEFLWHSHRPTRIYTSFASAWHPDGQRVLFLSDIEDRYGLFTIDPRDPGAKPSRLTDPGYDVLGAPMVLASANAIFFAGNGASPYERHAYRLQPGAAAASRVTDMPGQNSAYPSPDGRHLAILHSNDASPPELYLGRAGGEAERITQSPLPEFRERSWARARYVSFPSKIDDYTLHARILEPPNLDPERRYPVLFGPMYSNTVRNRWAGVYSLMQQLLVQKGYIVVQVDIRGSTGYGRDFREEFLVDFAGDDIEDIVSAADYLETIPYVDPDRFGIWGSSYGGTLTIYSLLKKPGLFRAGVAGASAVDPYFFGTDDVAIVRRPDTHPDVFANQAVRFAANLEDHLLLIHGMQDQVVPFKTIAVFAEELIRQGKNFDFALAPGATHGWRRETYHAKFLFGKLLEHFDRHLQPIAGRNRGSASAQD